MQRTIQEARKGKHGAVHVLAGAESFLVERAVQLLRVACLGEGPDGFNDERFHGKGLSGQAVVSAARTLPMMAQARFVLVRDADAMAPSELEALVGYLEDPAPSTCLVLTATKLDGRMRLTKLAKKRGYLADAKPLKPAAAMQFARGEAKRRGHELDPRAADALENALGADLSAIDDALERLSLFVGDGAPIDEAAVEACVTRVRAETIWALVDSVGLKRAGPALAAAASLLAAREPPLRILAMVARQLRMIAKMREALADGLRGPEAAKRAGAPPFKARELTEAARHFNKRALREAFATLAMTDRALKGSKRPGAVVLEEALLRLCAAEPATC